MHQAFIVQLQIFSRFTSFAMQSGRAILFVSHFHSVSEFSFAAFKDIQPLRHSQRVACKSTRVQDLWVP